MATVLRRGRQQDTVESIPGYEEQSVTREGLGWVMDGRDKAWREVGSPALRTE